MCAEEHAMVRHDAAEVADEQTKAQTADEGPDLIIAGASGAW